MSEVRHSRHTHTRSTVSNIIFQIELVLQVISKLADLYFSNMIQKKQLSI